MTITKYTHQGNAGRVYKLYGCAKRGCDRINTDYESFGAFNGKSYCRNHIPLYSRFILWLQERR